MEEKQYITETKDWIDQFIVKHSICPFAKKVVDDNKIAYHVILDTDFEKLMYQFLALVDKTTLDTAFFIYPTQFQDYLEFLDFYYACEMILEDSAFDAQYQVVAFHPDYLFGGEDPESHSHKTNRSPYPMIHLLRRQQVEDAITSFGDTDKITERNIDYLNKLYNPE